MANQLSAVEELKDIKKILTNLSYGESQVESAVKSLATLLYNHSTHNSRRPGHLQQLAFQMGIVKALIGIMGSSNKPSLLAKAAGCVALLAHGNEEGRSLLGEMDAVSKLVGLLSPRSCEGSSVCWHRDWVKVYEQALIAVRKLTFMNGNNQQQLAVIGGIKLVIEISIYDNFLCNYHQFPVIAKQKLESCVLNKKLTSRVAAVSGNQKESVLRRFNALSLSESGLATHYPAFNVSLFTVGEELISDAIVQEGVVWPDHTPFPKDSKLTNVIVTCVEDGGHVWCQFCTEKPRENVTAMNESLERLPPPVTDGPSHPLLTVGDVYAAYYDSSMFSDHYLLTSQWVRARLLSMEATKVEMSMVQVLAVDYGFTVTVPNTHLTVLPSECRGIPPQAIPCKLTGLQPPPTSVSVLENAAAVLRNIAFEKLAFRSEIMAFGGTEALLRIIRYPHKPTVLQALGALLNMAVSKQLRAEMGRKGAVNVLLEMCKECSSDVETLEQVVNCLVNLIIGCQDNITRVIEQDGDKILSELSTKQQISDRILHSIHVLLQSVTPHRSEGVPHTDPAHIQMKRKKLDSIYQAKRRANGERVHSKPVLHCPESDSECEEDEAMRVVACGAGAGAGLETDSVDYETAVSGCISPTKTYTVDSQLPLCEDDHNSFVAVDSIEDLTSSLLRRTVCAFMNMGQLCTIHIGVGRKGTVRGVKVHKKSRDLLLVAIDNLMSEFTPKIHHNQYSIQFVPVHGRGQRSIDDLFVVELILKESVFHQVYTVRKKNRQGDAYDRCYYRIGPSNEQLSFQELQDIVAMDEGCKYECEVSALEKNINRLKMAVSKSRLAHKEDS